MCKRRDRCTGARRGVAYMYIAERERASEPCVRPGERVRDARDSSVSIDRRDERRERDETLTA
jgi:hypothetical protein